MSILWYPGAATDSRVYSLADGVSDGDRGGNSCVLRYLLLVEVRPDVHDEDHDEQNTPCCEGAYAPADALLVEQEPDAY